MEVVPGDFTDARVVALLEAHVAAMRVHSPPGSVHALDLERLQTPDISFWTVLEDAVPVGCGAMKALDDATGEIKSMRTDARHLRKGVAALLLDHIIDVARERGYRWLRLETGSGKAFEPALALYRKNGFVSGAAFGGYEATDFNQFLHLDLGGPLSILPFTPERAHYFHDINVDWIEDMFRLEQTDRDVLENPIERIIAPGGDILFVAAEGLGIVGAGALQKTGEGSFELTKMGVLKSARGLQAGGYLLDALIARAEELGATKLYLLTNSICEAAIHLYERAGFEHDEDVMRGYGTRYQRCDVAMRYRPRRNPSQ